jgi:LysR family hydrogen peroxide-inducible transcriptional activator
MGTVFSHKLPNLKHLSYLLALDKHQHFNKAAQACFVSQSTLSSAILKLEQQLDCQLLERDHKRFIFTQQGKQVVKLARQLLLNANELVSYAQQQNEDGAASVRLGCIPTIAPFLLTDLVLQSQKQLPKLDLYLREDTTEKLMVQLAQGDIDCAILALPIPRHDFASRFLGKDAFYIAGNKRLVDLFLHNSDYQSLPDKSIFLLNQEHCLTEHAISACQLTDNSKVNDFSASSLATLVQMTAFHQGITFLPAMAVNKGLGNSDKLTVLSMQGNAYRQIGMLWRKNSLRLSTFNSIGDIVSDLLTFTSSRTFLS